MKMSSQLCWSAGQVQSGEPGLAKRGKKHVWLKSQAFYFVLDMMIGVRCPSPAVLLSHTSLRLLQDDQQPSL